jgi:hypothetical protein
MTRPRGLTVLLLAGGAIAIAAIVYATWLWPDDQPLFSVGVPEGPAANGHDNTIRVEGDKRRKPPPRRSPASREAKGPAVGPVSAPPASLPAADQYDNSLERVLSRLRPAP